MKNKLLFFILLLCITHSNAQAQTYSQAASVQLDAVVQSSPPQITLSWSNFSEATSYTIYRKTKEEDTWAAGVGRQPPHAYWQGFGDRVSRRRNTIAPAKFYILRPYASVRAGRLRRRSALASDNQRGRKNQQQ